MAQLFGLFFALFLAVIAQNWLGDGNINAALILYLVAGGVFAWSIAGPERWPALPPRRTWPKHGWMLVLAGAFLVVIATMGGFVREQYGGWAFWMWAVGVALFLIGAWLDGPSPDPAAEEAAARAWYAPVMQRRWLFLTLFLILAVAVFARFYALGLYPHGLQSDEANNGLDALKWLGGAGWIPYAETNEGQATLFTWIIALFIQIFGQSVTSMRMAAAAIGVLTVLAFYALAREFYDQRIALLTAALLAADRWHITFSRIVYELILVPLVISLQILFLVKALKTGRRRWWALAGAMLALGLNTYTAYRVVPFFMLAYFAWWLITHRDRMRRDIEGMGLFFAAALVAVAPLGVYIIRHWSVFISRMNHISVFRDVEAAGSYAPIWSNLHKVLLMFNYQGDSAPLNNLPGAPMLHAAVGALAVLGLIWALRWFWKEIPALYLLWFGSFISLAVLSVAHEAPNARRPIGLIPLIYLLVAVAFTGLWQAWQRAFGAKRTRPLVILLTALVLFVMGANLNTYFRVQAVDQAVWYAYSPEESAIGAYLADQPQNVTIYLDPQYFGHSGIRFLDGKHDIIPLNLTRDIPLRQHPANDILFILEPKDQLIVPLLQRLYPAGVFEAHRDRYGRVLFLSYAIPASAFADAQGLIVSYIAGADLSQPSVRQQKVNAIDFDFSTPETQPLLPPFAARFEGALLIPTYGDYRLALTADGGEATLYLDDQVVLSVKNGEREETLSLAGGFQALRLDYVAAEHPGVLRLQWATPDHPDLTVIPPDAFYNLPAASNGLLGAYYDNPDWSGQPTLVQRDLFIAPNDVVSSPYSVRWRGKIAAPETGTYVFGTRSDDGSTVTIDGQLVVDNGGQHGAIYKEGAISLTQGYHDIEVDYSDMGGSRAMELWWRPPGGAKTLIPSAYLRPVTQLPEDTPLPPMPQAPTVTSPETQPQPGGPQQPGPEPEAAPPPVGGQLGDFPQIQPPVLWTYGSCGSGDTELMHPAGVAIDEDGLTYVADTGNHRIVQLDEDGKLMNAWGEAGDRSGQFSEVFDLAITPEGDVAALDAARQIISLWSPDGELQREIGAGLALYHPRGMGVAANGDFFIADTGGGRIVQADEEGALLNTFGGPDAQLGSGQPTDAAISADGALYVPEPAAGLLWRVAMARGEMRAMPGPNSNTVESPHVSVMPDGRVFLTDPENGRALIFDKGLYPLVQFGGKGTAPGQFSRTLGIAVTPGMVIVTDPDLCRVTAFSF